MALRTTETKLRAVITTYDNVDVYPYLNTASVVVDGIVDCATDLDITVSDELLAEIETYLAAHFYALRYPQYQDKKAGRARGKLMGETAMGYKSTLWGQMAIELDPTGCLEGAGNLLNGYWLGKDST